MLQWECSTLLESLTDRQVTEVQETIIETFGTLDIGIEQIPWIPEFVLGILENVTMNNEEDTGDIVD